MSRLLTPEDLETFRQNIVSKRDPNGISISVCAGAGCLASGAGQVITAFQKEIKKENLSTTIDLKGAGCPGFCEKGPVVVIYPVNCSS